MKELEYPNFAFRFRPYNQLSIKEILYGELFFSTQGELNDPNDAISSSLFPNKVEVYERLITYFLIDKVNKKFLNGLVDVARIARFLAETEITYDELIKKIDTKVFAEIWFSSFNREGLDFANITLPNFRIWIRNSDGGFVYIVSFSKIWNEPLMWSHYANNYRGFCLCFNLIERKIYSNSEEKHDRLRNEYKFNEIKYQSETSFVNGFYRFPKSVWGEEVDLKQKIKHWNDRDNFNLTKYLSWEYEKEIRLIHDDWMNPKSKWRSVERIFNYHSDSFTGIILGALLTRDEIEEIRHAVFYYRYSALKKNKILPIFHFYEMKIERDFKLSIKIVDGWSLGCLNNWLKLDQLEKEASTYEQLKKNDYFKVK